MNAPQRWIESSIDRTVLSIESPMDGSIRHYHTSHLWAGFIFALFWQLNSLVNSNRFESGPLTLYLGGLCESFSI